MVTLEELQKRSHQAVCGTAEREVVIKSENLSQVKRLLRAKGFTFVGSGPAGSDTTKVWFVRSGLGML